MEKIREICSKLKEKRKESGYTIEEVVEKTKLHPSVIRDMEEGNLDNIDPIYLKGFVKIYTSFLGLEAKEALEELSVPQVMKPQRKIKQEDPYIAKIKNVIGIKKRVLPKITITPKIRKTIAFSLLGIILFISLVTLVRFTAKKISLAVKQRKKQEERADFKPVVPQVASEEIVVSLTAKRDCFLRVKIDKKVLFEGILEKGAIETWKADEIVEFKISDGSSVYIEVNGSPLPPLTSMRKPIKSLKITPSGVSVEK